MTPPTGLLESGQPSYSSHTAACSCPARSPVSKRWHQLSALALGGPLFELQCCANNELFLRGCSARFAGLFQAVTFSLC